ncbi:nucleoside triphosphate pyrophosphatase [Fusobacterium sp. IOR10]|uniref:nucleoside triphosphate pyrophosphatase n=1 Tax=Fusobacterium sp. IOR10 TaxID=2665157 RepID=UPI0013D41139|nr:Maf family protein [Fusobacterium sp. IOR10]
MILASKSPRRKEILENFGFNLQIKTKEIEETSSKENIIEKIKDISNKKAYEVANENKDDFIVSADTIVSINNKILGKPKNQEDVYNMLRELSGKSHEVITAFSIININKNICYSDAEITKVFFNEITDADIKWYIETKEPFDKAGSYGIQGKGALFVNKIEGDFFSVMGFPLGKFLRALKKLNIDLNCLEKL